MTAPDYDLFDLGALALQSGAVLPDAKLAYKTYGTLSPAKDNVIVFPCAYNGLIAENEARIGNGSPLDPERYFIIVFGLFGNGQSSSPSNTPAPFDGPRFPRVTITDNVRAQHRLVTELFGIERVQLVTGFSMGAIQSFHWGALFPAMVERIAPFCGAARCSRHNYVFLASLKATLSADGLFRGGDYVEKPIEGLKAFGRIYAGWAFSQAFYREEVDLKVMGFASTDDFLERFWDTLFQERDPNDLLAMLWSWQHADISANELYNGDFPAALAAIEARATVMPSATDLYFPVADNEAEVARMRNARCVPIPSIWGHVAGNAGANPADTAFVNARIAELLAS
ncbi:alpha/beta fold hydrolase [Labrys monachus]|uniref:Homoserine O-acetyltransferase n=1 Tax=Labrys monachus TaxID=217067 RepID=A0ABU0FJY2_9HYPH|nr:alpha/beta fold hydrolase [Labrys monachus]MDQ0394424.1 homoserine O-acetyltransferase [Labrys monachus]